jgi:hypothetical protein
MNEIKVKRDIICPNCDSPIPDESCINLVPWIGDDNAVGLATLCGFCGHVLDVRYDDDVVTKPSGGVSDGVKIAAFCFGATVTFVLAYVLFGMLYLYHETGAVEYVDRVIERPVEVVKYVDRVVEKPVYIERAGTLPDRPDRPRMVPFMYSTTTCDYYPSDIVTYHIVEDPPDGE